MKGNCDKMAKTVLEKLVFEELQECKEKLNQINNIVNYEMLDKEHLLVAINEIRKILRGDSNE